jgi:dTDP-4-dehydrorhamnose 3,5-epimerase
VIWNDPTLGIAWPIDQPTLSGRDQQLPRLADIRETLAPYRTEP